MRNAPQPITILGRPTCEDTAIVRDRLQRYAIPFTEADVDRDAGAGRLAETLNDGNRSTPTILFGGTDAVLIEPALDVLDARLLEEGWPIHPPEPSQFTGDLIATPIPLLTVVDETGAAFRLSQFRGRRQLAVFFAHASECMTCAGFARQLAAVQGTLADADARALVVVPGEAADAARWRAEVTDRLPIVADRGGRWKAAVTARVQFDVDAGGALLLALDRYLAPRIGSVAPDAGGLITPLKAAEWLEFASFECAECATPVGWADD
jgi:glutaredoxin